MNVPPRTRLVINADDYGLSPAVNAGILEAHAAGGVTSTSMMVHCPGWDDAVARRASAPAMGVGLHFNLLVGAPLSAAPTLMDRPSGRFLTLAALVTRAIAGRVDADEVEAECEAQCRAIEARGITLTHMDSHRHTHALPGVRRGVARVAARRNLPLRRPLESPFRFALDAKAQLHRATVSAAWWTSAMSAPVTRSSDHFIGIALQGGTRFAQRLADTLNALPAGSCELMVHPGRVDDALARVDAYTWQRETELRALTSADFRDRLGASGAALVTFAQL